MRRRDLPNEFVKGQRLRAQDLNLLREVARVEQQPADGELTITTPDTVSIQRMYKDPGIELACYNHDDLQIPAYSVVEIERTTGAQIMALVRTVRHSGLKTVGFTGRQPIRPRSRGTVYIDGYRLVRVAGNNLMRGNYAIAHNGLSSLYKFMNGDFVIVDILDNVTWGMAISTHLCLVTECKGSSD